MPLNEVKYDIRDITKDVTEWCDQVFPDRTADDMIKKLLEEMQEFADRPLDAWEVADIMIIFFDLCNHLGFDISKIIHHKMAINRKRTWTKENGVLKHVETTRHSTGGDGQEISSGQHHPSADPGRASVWRGDPGK